MNDQPSEVSHPVPGYPPSGLTDPERIVLADLAVEHVMRAIDCPEGVVRELLGDAAANDRVTISGVHAARDWLMWATERWTAAESN